MGKRTRLKVCLPFFVISPLGLIWIFLDLRDVGEPQGKFDPSLFAHIYRYKINPKGICDKRVETLFVVPSRPSGQMARDAIRRTWAAPGRLKDLNSTIVFLIGSNDNLNMQLRSESEQFGDIIQADFVDSYLNLTLKSTIMIRWVDEFCPHIKLLVKVDDDIYLYHANLAKFLNENKDRPQTMVGNLVRDAKPFRSKSNKWFVDKTEFEPDTYPDYLFGACYVISGDTLPSLSALTMTVPLFKFEDIYVTGQLANMVANRRFDGVDLNQHDALMSRRIKLRHSDDLDHRKIHRCRHPSKVLENGFSPTQLLDFHEKINDVNIDMNCKNYLEQHKN